MMDWQQTVAILIAGIAIVYLSCRGWRMLTGNQRGCGVCTSCPAKAAPTSEKMIIPLDSLARSKIPRTGNSAGTTD